MDLKFIELDSFEICSGERFNLRLSYQLFGQPLHTAPVVLVNHALTGNSQVAGDEGWWADIIGPGKVIDTETYTVLAFNIPGNGFHQHTESFSMEYLKFKARDIARMFAIGLERLCIDRLYAIVGASVGGGLVWELAGLRPDLARHLIPIATDWKANDWLVANCYVQDQILNHSSQPVKDARRHAMTFYRTPKSLNSKFKGEINESGPKVESWLNHHGNSLKARFSVSAYKMMNQVLRTIRLADNKEAFLKVASGITGQIHLITISSDLLFKPEENWNTFIDLKTVKEDVTIGEIKSIHGHDAFLIEHGQLSKLLRPIFSHKYISHDHSQSSYIRNW
jgi:homoserine O-acetyltransferase